MRLSDSRCRVSSRSSEAMKLNLYGNATLIVYEYFRASVIMSYPRISRRLERGGTRTRSQCTGVILARLCCTKSSYRRRKREKKQKRESYVKLT